jgi:hypothetical protein
MQRRDIARAGHQEIQGETIAKFEFFQHDFNPYSRYLDTDKVDLVLRRRVHDRVQYADVQVKYGRLYGRLYDRATGAWSGYSTRGRGDSSS